MIERKERDDDDDDDSEGKKYQKTVMVMSKFCDDDDDDNNRDNCKMTKSTYKKSDFTYSNNKIIYVMAWSQQIYGNIDNYDFNNNSDDNEKGNTVNQNN